MPVLSTLGAAIANVYGFTSGLIKDQYFNLVSLLLPGNGTNGAQNNTFLDSGTANSGSGFTITRNGNTTQGTFSPFSQTGWSSYSAGGSGNYWTVGGGMPSGQGTAFTLECWIYVTDLSTYRTITRGDSAGQLDLTIDSTGLVNIANTNTANICQSQAGAVQANRWHHIMVTRTTGNVYRIYVDGVGGTASSAYNTSMTANPRIGYNGFTQSYNFVGYISNFRVTNTLVQSGNFTPPTTPLTAISGTQLLIFQSNRFVDNSGNSNSIAPAGTAAITPFSPFAPTQSYSAAAVGGSGYFDGTGDYLTWTGTAAGSGAFSYEFWIYSTNGFGTFRAPLGVIATSGYNSALDCRMSGTTITAGQYNVTNNNFTVESLQANTWYHVVICRNASNQMTVFLNGQRSSTGVLTISTNFSGLTSAIGRLDPSNGGDVTGYITNVRLITGSTPYDPTQTTITVPTAPLTAITNTQLLLNFTNAGVVDATAKNVLETVGNAQISTSVSKFGGGSIAFDGTGDYLLTPANNLYAFGTGNFTIEGWFNFNGTPNTSSLVSSQKYYTAGFNGNWILRITSTTSVAWASYDGQANEAYKEFTVPTMSSGTWYYFALVRSGTAITFYLNGTASSSGTLTDSKSLNDGSASGIFIGKSTINNDFNGYIDDLRITRGVARTITASPTAPFPVL